MLPGTFTFSDSVQSPLPFSRFASTSRLARLQFLTSTFLRFSLTSSTIVSDEHLGDLFAFSVVVPGQQPVVMCTSNEKERLQWRLAFTYSIHHEYLIGSFRNQIQFASLAQERLRDMRRIALQISQCKNRLLILPPSFRRVDKSVVLAQAATLDAAGGASLVMASSASVSKLRSSSAYASAQSPPSVIYELAGRVVSDTGMQSDGPRQRAAAAAAPLSMLLQTMKPQTARAVDVASAPHMSTQMSSEVEDAPAKQHMDLRPHQVRLAVEAPSM